MKFGTLQQLWTRLQSRDQKLKFLIFKMAVAAILKIAFLAITHQPAISDFSFCHVAFVGMPAQEIRHITFPMSDFSDILYEEAEQHVNKGYMTKTANF